MVPTADAATQDESQVYFIQLGSRVKIGFSTNTVGRLRDLPHERVLGVLPGTLATERSWHQRFAHLRIVGEWFEAAPDLLEAVRVAVIETEPNDERVRFTLVVEATGDTPERRYLCALSSDEVAAVITRGRLAPAESIDRGAGLKSSDCSGLRDSAGGTHPPTF